VLTILPGNWSLSFLEQRGAPAQVQLGSLSSWSESTDAGIRYFSGTGAYTQNVQADASWFMGGKRLWLDLGNVRNLAEVSVNGKTLGILWKAPVRIDVTDALRPGVNQLQIKVTNLWVNRLIGDQQPGAQQKYTFTTTTFYKADASLLPSGLLGPVRVMARQQ
jgi:Glycosyl hydrolases family 2, sugar binding domain